MHPLTCFVYHLQQVLSILLDIKIINSILSNLCSIYECKVQSNGLKHEKKMFNQTKLEENSFLKNNSKLK